MVWFLLGLVGLLLGAVLLRLRAHRGLGRDARRVILAPLQRRARLDGWGGPVLVDQGWRTPPALEWTRRDGKLRLIARRGPDETWGALLLLPYPRRGGRTLILDDEVAEPLMRRWDCGIQLQPGGAEVSLAEVPDTERLAAFVREALPVLEDLRVRDTAAPISAR